ncbi:VP2 protein [Wanken orbivirus]|nr:VP2 protein [Wanken orbivirus]
MSEIKIAVTDTLSSPELYNIYDYVIDCSTAVPKITGDTNKNWDMIHPQSYKTYALLEHGERTAAAPGLNSNPLKFSESTTFYPSLINNSLAAVIEGKTLETTISRRRSTACDRRVFRLMLGPSVLNSKIKLGMLSCDVHTSVEIAQSAAYTRHAIHRLTRGVHSLPDTLFTSIFYSGMLAGHRETYFTFNVSRVLGKPQFMEVPRDRLKSLREDAALWRHQVEFEDDPTIIKELISSTLNETSFKNKLKENIIMEASDVIPRDSSIYSQSHLSYKQVTDGRGGTGTSLLEMPTHITFRNPIAPFAFSKYVKVTKTNAITRAAVETKDTQMRFGIDMLLVAGAAATIPQINLISGIGLRANPEANGMDSDIIKQYKLTDRYQEMVTNYGEVDEHLMDDCCPLKRSIMTIYLRYFEVVTALIASRMPKNLRRRWYPKDFTGNQWWNVPLPDGLVDMISESPTVVHAFLTLIRALHNDVREVTDEDVDIITDSVRSGNSVYNYLSFVSKRMESLIAAATNPKRTDTTAFLREAFLSLNILTILMSLIPTIRVARAPNPTLYIVTPAAELGVINYFVLKATDDASIFRAKFSFLHAAGYLTMPVTDEWLEIEHMDKFEGEEDWTELWRKDRAEYVAWIDEQKDEHPNDWEEWKAQQMEVYEVLFSSAQHRRRMVTTLRGWTLGAPQFTEGYFSAISDVKSILSNQQQVATLEGSSCGGVREMMSFIMPLATPLPSSLAVVFLDHLVREEDAWAHVEKRIPSLLPTCRGVVLVQLPPDPPRDGLLSTVVVSSRGDLRVRKYRADFMGKTFGVIIIKMRESMVGESTFMLKLANV